MEEGQVRGDQSSPVSRPQPVIRVDEECHAVLDAYRRWLEERDAGRVSMAEAVRDLLLRKAQDVMREDR